MTPRERPAAPSESKTSATKASATARNVARRASRTAAVAPSPPAVLFPLDANDPALYLNRELSQLEFNQRVLAQTRDPRVPLLERLRYMSICSTNLDEFFEIRVSGLKEQLSFNVTQPGPDGIAPAELMRRVSERAHALVEEQYKVLNEQLLPALSEAGLRVHKRTEWTPEQREWVHEYFENEVIPVVTPMGLDPAHPFPNISNKALCFIVSLDGTDAFGRDSSLAVLQAPRCLPRVVRLGREVAGVPDDFVLLSSIIHAHIGELFPGMRVTGCYQFRVTRDSDLWVDEEEVNDLLAALKGELPNRKFGQAVRLEVADNCKARISRFLLQQFGLSPDDLYRVNGPVNVHRLAAIYDSVERPDLKFPPFTPGVPIHVARAPDIFTQLRRGDILLHHPFQSFTPVVEFVKRAAADPDVLAIKQTLYRSGPDSPLVDALIAAARAGKEVTAVVELRARFDEAHNIDLATRLQAAGAMVAYGIVEHKAHVKACLVVRREPNGLRRYVHLGTGNYHMRTTRAYTDFSLLTAGRRLGEDVHKLFLQLTGPGKVRSLRKILQSPFTLHTRMVELIHQEATFAREGKPARIIAKMNSLAEPQIIQALYAASQAGVSIDLIVRGICCLRPGVPGLSDNIRVRSIVGRFLEHSRIFYFRAGGADVTYCASADWMERNFFRRVEAAFPIESHTARTRIIEEGLSPYLADDANAWLLQGDGSWQRAETRGPEAVSAQQMLLNRLAG